MTTTTPKPKRASRSKPTGPREVPILFSDAMVRAILDGSKTETRRIVKPQPLYGGRVPSGPHWKWPPGGERFDAADDDLGDAPRLVAALLRKGSPYGQPGDLLYVREGFWQTVRYPYTLPSGEDSREWGSRIHFAADGPPANTPNRHYPEGLRGGGISAPEPDACWLRRPSIYLPKRRARLWLRVTSVRAERLHDITGDGAIREGVVLTQSAQNLALVRDPYRSAALVCFQDLWTEINGAESWAANHWVWVVAFERVAAPSREGRS